MSETDVKYISDLFERFKEDEEQFRDSLQGRSTEQTVISKDGEAVILPHLLLSSEPTSASPRLRANNKRETHTLTNTQITPRATIGGADCRRLLHRLHHEGTEEVKEEEQELAVTFEKKEVVLTAYMAAYNLCGTKQPPLRCLLSKPLAPELSAAHCWLDDCSVQPLAMVLPRLDGLQKLHLSGNRIGDKGCLLLCSAIGEKRGGVDTLDLDSNHIRRAGAEALALLIREGKLQNRSISTNKMGDESAARLAEGLSSPTCKMRELDISDNQAGVLSLC